MMSTHAEHEAAARDACRTAGLTARGLTLLHHHATFVYVLPEEGAVARVSPESHREPATRSIALTRWLADQGIPVTEPIAVTQPIHRPPFAVTFWRYYPQPDVPPPPSAHLGRILRDLHSLPKPPTIELPPYQPLTTLRQTVQCSGALSESDRLWVLGAIDESLVAYDDLEFVLDEGTLHGDAYPGNTLWNGQTALLGDWDETATGPREIDLANTFQGVRFGRTQQELMAFVEAYGYDPSRWPGLSVLTRIRDLHTLGSFVRRAEQGDIAAAEQLAFRLTSLRRGGTTEKWNSR